MMPEYLYSPSHNRLVFSTCAEAYDFDDLQPFEPIALDIPTILERAVQDPDLYDRMGTCTYSSPCIIGLGFTPEQREMLINSELDGQPITYLENRGVVTFPDAPQLYRAESLQWHFDNESPSTLERKINELRG